MRPEILARAIELDDPYPLHVCPGCKQHIDKWWLYAAHMPPLTETHRNNLMANRRYKRDPAPWPFIAHKTWTELCPWDLDYLTARQFRRNYIAQHQAVAS